MEVFDVPMVNIFRRAWPKRHVSDLCLPYVAALDRKAPHLRTLSKISPILFLEEAKEGSVVHADVETNGDENAIVESTCTPSATKLQSATVHALTLAPSLEPEVLDEKKPPKMRLPASVTFSGFGTSNLANWNFDHVEKLRFTSVVNGGVLRTGELLHLPSLTHLALPLWKITVDTTKALLGLPTLKRLVLFVLFDPSPPTRGLFDITPETENDPLSQPSSNVPASSSAPNQPGPGTSPLLSTARTDADTLRDIHDNRLLLFNIREMVSLCRVTAQSFWEEVELRASHRAVHLVLGRLRSMAGKTLSGP